MPIYEYRCPDCGQEFEEIVTSSSQTVVCPKCESEAPEKLMSCCRFKTAGANMPPIGQSAPAPSAASACAGCTSKNCSSCG